MDLATVSRLFEYDQETGLIKNRSDRSRLARAGSPAGRKTDSGYISICINQKQYLAHHIAWLFIYGELPSHQVDHINGIRDDNSRANLRAATASQNAHNRKIASNNTSCVKGVHFCKLSKAWIARIRVNDISVYREKFQSLEEAAIAIKINRERIHGEFACHE